MKEQCMSPSALDVLRTLECDRDRVRITSGQLDRSLYEEVNEVLVRLGGKWKGGRTKAHLFPYDPRPLLAGVIETGNMPPKNPTAFFPTPPHLVASVMQSPLFRDIEDGDMLLEPSAGFGALAEGMRARLSHRQVLIDCCEILPINQQVLRRKGFAIVHDDFLQYHPEKRYRAIVMNPPFAVEKDRLSYITHIQHAWNLVAEGGFLIAFAPAGYTFRSDKKSYDFLSFVLTYGSWEELPPRSFHESGTDSVITLITLEKQDVSWRYHPQGKYPSWYCQQVILYADNTDDFRFDRDHFIEQLDSGKLCSDPHAPAWSQTQKSIHRYYQNVIMHARKCGQHFDIRSHDWPYLEQHLMCWWDEEWTLTKPPISIQPGDVDDVTHTTDSDDTREARTIIASQPDDEALSQVSEAPTVSYGSTGTLLYSPLSIDSEASYEQVCSLSEQICIQRDAYTALPWVMESLVGTTWRNISTGESQVVHHIGVNRFKKPVLCKAPVQTKKPGGAFLECIGFWSDNRYIVEHWVRVDHLKPLTQVYWFGLQLGWLRKQIALYERKIEEYRRDPTNRHLCEREKQNCFTQLQEAEHHLRTFSATHHLSIPFEVLNSGVIGSEQEPAQMVLF